MLEVADVFRLHGAAYRERFGVHMSPGQARAMRDIVACRTAYFGGHLKQCDHCQQKLYVYHSCGNRHCPKCHREQTERWIDKQRARLLPSPHYLLTFTLPEELRAVARESQKKVYGLLMRSAAAALRKLTADPGCLGGRPGCLAVLHTWTRAMLYHPHVHMLVTAGGLSIDGTKWAKPKNPAFLVPVQALSIIFRAKMCAGLKKAGLLDRVSSKVWKKSWVVHCQPAGSGQKVLDYLGRYVFRIAITNSRLEQIENDHVTFRYRDNRSQELRHVTLPSVEFIGRFLQHVLPRGCAKVRNYGIYGPSCRKQLEQARALLAVPLHESNGDCVQNSLTPKPSGPQPARCPYCKVGQLITIGLLPHLRRIPP